MRLTVEYLAQVRQAAGLGQETVEVKDGASVQGLVMDLAVLHGELFRDLVLTAEGTVRPSILVFVGEEQVRTDPDSAVILHTGDRVTIMSPIAGG